MKPGRHICTACNYIYEEGNKANVCFDQLPDTWLCPQCGVDKDKYQPCSCVTFSKEGMSEDMLRKMTVGELVAENPASAIVFERHGIDYCCGGKLKLVDACQNKNVSFEKLSQELLSHNKDHVCTDTDWSKATLRELVDHIVQTYHLPLRDQLERIQGLSSKVASIHGERHPEMKEVASVFENFKAQLELHMQKEEIILFPAILRTESGDQPQLFGCGGGIENPIKVMFQEHDDAGDALKKMRALTADYCAPEDACNTFRVLLNALQDLEREMHHHVHKENNILFPRALAISHSSLAKC